MPACPYSYPPGFPNYKENNMEQFETNEEFAKRMETGRLDYNHFEEKSFEELLQDVKPGQGIDPNAVSLG